MAALVWNFDLVLGDPGKTRRAVQVKVGGTVGDLLRAAKRKIEATRMQRGITAEWNGNLYDNDGCLWDFSSAADPLAAPPMTYYELIEHRAAATKGTAVAAERSTGRQVPARPAGAATSAANRYVSTPTTILVRRAGWSGSGDSKLQRTVAVEVARASIPSFPWLAECVRAAADIPAGSIRMFFAATVAEDGTHWLKGEQILDDSVASIRATKALFCGEIGGPQVVRVLYWDRAPFASVSPDWTPEPKWVETPLAGRRDVEAQHRYGLIGRSRETAEIAVANVNNMVHQAGAYRPRALRDLPPIIAVSPQMFGSGKTCLGQLFKAGLSECVPEVKRALVASVGEPNVRGGLAELSFTALERLRKCVAVSVDLQANRYSTEDEFTPSRFGHLLARALHGELKGAVRACFVEHIMGGPKRPSVREVLTAFGDAFREAGGTEPPAVFVHVDEIGVAAEWCPRGMTPLEALRDLRDRLLNIAVHPDGHAVYATGNAPLYLVLEKVEVASSPCVTKNVLIDAISEGTVKKMLAKAGCPAERSEICCRSVMQATSGVARLTVLSIDALKGLGWPAATQLPLTEFSRVGGIWRCPPPNALLKRLLSCAVNELEFSPDDVLRADPFTDARQLLLGDQYSMDGVPLGIDISVIEAVRACNLYVVRKRRTAVAAGGVRGGAGGAEPIAAGKCLSDGMPDSIVGAERWHTVWPRLLLDHWTTQHRCAAELADLFRGFSAGRATVSVRKGDSIEAVVLRVLRVRLTGAAVGAHLCDVLPFLHGSAVADSAVASSDSRGIVEYMPQIIRQAGAALLGRTTWEDGVNCFAVWSARLRQDVPRGTVSMTIDVTGSAADSGAYPRDWQCNVSDCAALDRAMTTSRFYVPLRDSASMDLRLKLATCTIDFIIKHAEPSRAEVAEAIANELPWCKEAAAPVVLVLLSMSQPARYGVAGDSDGEVVECDGREIATRWLPGATSFGVALPANLTFIVVHEAGMRNMLNGINVDACMAPSPTLISVLTPPTSPVGGS